VAVKMKSLDKLEFVDNFRYIAQSRSLVWFDSFQVCVSTLTAI